jgi:hemerythrin-like metal-binding protein
MPITWNSSLETGHRQIDLQHQELIELINEAEAGQAAGRDPEVLQDVMPRLMAYVLFHFATEDGLMTQSGVNTAHATAHRQAHQEFADRVSAMKSSIDAGESGLLAPLVIYLQNWLVEHIMKTDRELANALAKRR